MESSQQQLAGGGQLLDYEHPLEFVEDGVQYRRVPADRPRLLGKPSSYWSKGALYSAVLAPAVLVFWICNLCHVRVKLFNQTSSNAAKHWKRLHEVQAASDTVSTTESTSTPPQPSIVAVTTSMAPSFGLTFRMNVQMLRYWMMRWIIEDHRPFAIVDSNSFRNMMVAANSAILSYLPSRQTLQRWIDKVIDRAKEEVIILLGTTESKIHISFDLWTSPAGDSMLGVIAHFVAVQDSKAVSKVVPLALRHLHEKHTGEVIAEHLVNILSEYGVGGQQLGVFIADNASNNDTAIPALCERLGIDPAHRRVRCLAHIVNLAAKAFLFGKSVEAFERNIESQDQSFSVTKKQLEKAQDDWRRFGPVGRLHNIVKYVRRSDIRRAEFSLISIGVVTIDGEFLTSISISYITQLGRLAGQQLIQLRFGTYSR